MMGSPFIDKELRLREGTYPKLGNSWGSLPVRPVDSCHVHPLPCLSQEDEGVGSHSVLRKVSTSTHGLSWLCSLHLHL